MVVWISSLLRENMAFDILSSTNIPQTLLLKKPECGIIYIYCL